MKPVVFYHDNCADGFGAAYAAWCRFKDDAEYISIQYNRFLYNSENATLSIGRNTVALRGRRVYVLDFSFPRPQMEHIMSVANGVVWLDHHKTAFEIWCGKAPDSKFQRYEENSAEFDIVLDNNKSGALLSWEWFFPREAPPKLLLHIDDYDRWQFKISGTKEINKAIWAATPWSFADWESFASDEKYDSLKDEGFAILRAHEANVRAVVSGATRQCRVECFDTLVGLAANCPPHLQSDVGHELATRSGTFGLLWYINKDGKCLCSLRSNGDYDVSAIAKFFGGGGHKNAAGFETSIENVLRWIK